MQISDAKLTEFQAIYSEEFGIEIDRKQALELATPLLRMMQLVYRPITKQQLSKYENENEQANTSQITRS